MNAASEPPPEQDAPAETPQTEPVASEAPASEPPAGEAPADEASEAPASEPPAPAGEASPPARPAESKSGVGKSLALIFVTVAIVALVILLLPRKADLIVDNGLGVPIRVFVNGVDRGRVEPYQHKVLSSLPAGPVVLAGHELGPEGQTGRAFAELKGELSAPLFRQRRRAYIWNVEGKTEGYWIRTKGYGDRSEEVFTPEAYVPPGPLFVIPGRCEPLLDDAPKQVQVSGGAKGTTRDILLSSHRVQRLLMEQKAREYLGTRPPPRVPQNN